MVKNPPANAEDIKDEGLVPGLGRYPGEGNDNPLQYSCQENPMDRETLWVPVPGVAQSWTQLRTRQESVLGILLMVLAFLTFLPSQTSLPVLQMRKLMHVEVKRSAQSHRASEW